MPRPMPAGADPSELERRYLLEVRLGDRLRRASAAERATVYAEVYGEYARSVQGPPEDPGSLALQQQVLAPWLQSGVTLLEIGAGSGALSRAVAGRVKRALAIEAVLPDGAAEDAVVWMLNREAAERITPATVGVAFSCHVLEHLHPADLEGHLRQVLGWLAPGGSYVMVTPNRLLGPHDVSGYFEDRPRGLHLREYTHGELARALRSAGFAAVRAVNPSGTTCPLWWRTVPEVLLRLAGQRLRRRLFDQWPRMERRAPLRPLEQVALVASAPARPEREESLGLNG